MERIPTGIKGLDELIEGGFVKNSVILLAGQTGTGKTIFACQFLLEGLRKGENCYYATLEQSPEEIIKDVSRFSWGKEFEEYYKIGKLKIIYYPTTSVKELTQQIISEISKLGSKRFVLDNLSIAMMGWKETAMEIGKVRVDIFNFIKSLKNLNVTSILISEIPEEKTRSISRFGFEEFICDAVIILNYLEFGTGTSVRSLLIRKMRRTKHATDIFPFEIGDNGIVILSRSI